MIEKLVNKTSKLYEEYKVSNIAKGIEHYKNNWLGKVNFWGKELAKNGISANMVSIFGFIIGIMAINFLAMDLYFEALMCILINRFCDVLDGAVARAEGISNFGIFLDASLDFIFYGGVIFGFALSNQQENAIAACFLLFAFCASSCVMLVFGIVAEKNDKDKNKALNSSPFYLGGIAQGFETLTAFVLLCLMPFAFLPIAIILGCWCLIKAFVIITSAYYKLVIVKKSK